MSAMSQDEMGAKFSRIWAQLDDLNSVLSSFKETSIQNNTETRLKLDVISLHLERINGNVNCHEIEIEELQRFRDKYETLEAVYKDIDDKAREAKKEISRNRWLLIIAVLGIIGNLIKLFFI